MDEERECVCVCEQTRDPKKERKEGGRRERDARVAARKAVDMNRFIIEKERERRPLSPSLSSRCASSQTPSFFDCCFQRERSGSDLPTDSLSPSDAGCMKSLQIGVRKKTQAESTSREKKRKRDCGHLRANLSGELKRDPKGGIKSQGDTTDSRGDTATQGHSTATAEGGCMRERG